MGEPNSENSYEDYVKYQIKRSKTTQSITRRAESRRKWILEEMKKYGIRGKNLLCVGARHDSEIDFFRSNGYKYVVGIDLYESGKVRACDMSKMHIDPFIRVHRFQVVFSCESIEHCMDSKGFLTGLNLVCNDYFVCMCPALSTPSTWDCQQWSFMQGVKTEQDLREKLEECFDEFDVVACSIHKLGRRLFFILRKNVKKMEKKYPLYPVKVVKNKYRSGIFDFLPKNSVCAELGVDQGSFSQAILYNTHPSRFYAVDGYEKCSGQVFWKPKMTTEEVKQLAIGRIDRADKDKCCSLIVDFSFDFLQGLPDDHLDWAYLDTSHFYVDTLRELDLMKAKVKNDGFLCGHDLQMNFYNKHSGVRRAISEWLQVNTDYELYVIDNHLQWIIRKKRI